jgi:protein TonB
MKSSVFAALLVITLLGGCAAPQPAKSRPGAVLQGGDLPPVTPPRPEFGPGTPPTPIEMRNPVYPPEARKNNIEGTVVVEIVVGSDGKVREAHAVGTPDPLLAKAAVDAVLQSQFRPALKDGRPVAARMRVPITFNLKAKPPAK